MKRKTIILISIAVVVVAVAALVGFFMYHSNNSNTATQTESKGTYVALGDSVAAGYSTGAITDFDYCERTNQAYPTLVAAKLNLNLKTVACKSAQIQDGVLGEQTVGTHKIAPQLTALFNEPTPKLITLTIGVNDTGWVSYLSRCFTGVCGTANDTTVFQSAVTTMKANYKSMLTQIKAHYQTNTPTILATGYYRMFPDTPTANCTDLSGLDATERQWWKDRQGDINTAIQQAISETGVGKYVPVDFSGHEICSNDTWIQSLSTAGAFHPTQAGQSAIASAIESAY